MSILTLQVSESMLSVASKFKEIDPSLASKLAPFMVEAAWHERQWSLLNMHLAEVTEHTTSTRIAQVMACMYNNDRQGAYRALQQARLHCIKQLASGKLESYVRSYDDILNLQMLFELETTYAVGEEIEHVAKTQLHFRMTSDWEQKLNLMPFGSKFQGQLLDLRTIALEFLKSSDKKLAVDYFLMKNDLQRCKIARKEGNFEEAYRALVSIEYEPPSAHTSNEAMKCLARAKYLWHSGQRIDAIQFLSGQHLEPKGRLLLTRWKEEMGLLKLEELQTEYEDIVRRFTDYENATYRYAKDIQYSHYYLGRYYDRILTASEDITERQYLDTANSVCLEYVKTLELGSKFLYNAMPRLLTVWLDLGTFVSNDEGDSQAVIRRLFNDVTTRVKSSNISPQLWSVVLPRLVSRLDHQNSTICGALVAIIRKVFQAYPSSSVWHLIAHANISSTQHASSKARAIHCESILKKTAGGAEGRKLLKIVDQAKTVVRCLKELAQHSYDASSRSQPITPSLSSLKDIDICVPIEAAIMPTANITEDMPTIKRFGSKILVMSSLQKPRRISILGSNGQEYRFLCKANDDLRKDARMMEFNVMINTFLKKDREARDRSLYIRTYAVTPLGDLWGLIEWVNHTTPLKAIVQRQWEAMGKDVGKIAQLAKRELDPNNMRSVEDRIWAFENKVLPECPPVLHRWFLQTFREPSQWLAARTQFTRTLATMSIVGYILGLGDRHAENILLHEKTGDVVHVDVNMLFDRGQKLPVPEVVPFRLTHNLSDAMGLFGYEGTFRRSCEIVLRALQENKISLLSVFETLVHDPIVEWKRYGERQTIQARAKRQLDAIERKIDAAGNTIQNEVSRLIQDATSNSNLATMFIGRLKRQVYC
jgi:serine/threonine-protein kinase ATR